MKHAIITGASAGIGLETARQLDAEGWQVTNLSRRPCPVAGVTSIGCDFRQPAAVDAAARELQDQVRNAERTILIHNASLLRSDQCDSTSPDTFAEVMQINLAAPNALNHVLLPHMTAGSAVIYVGSTLSEKAVPGTYSYITSKHATVGMMRATCQDLAGRGVHTACICPGFTDTEMLRAHIGDDPDTAEAIAGMSAFGRLVQPAEIAETIVWAATHAVVNGAVIHANLGQVER